MVRIVGIGGGTGLSVLLRGLTEAAPSYDLNDSPSPLTISAIVCVSDNGGSSGRLRESLGVPAVGDLRNCLVALSEGNPTLRELFQYRFPLGDGLQGHAIGNMIVSALCLMSGSLGEAAELAGEVLGARGSVLPATEMPVTLCADLDSGTIARGEIQIVAAGRQIRKIWLEPEGPPPSVGVLDAIACADAIVLGPGSIYTSIVPNLLVAGVAEAVCNSPALKIFVCNLMTQAGESAQFTATDHLQVLQTHLGANGVDVCVLNRRPIEPALRDEYSGFGSEPVSSNPEEIAQMGVATATADLLEESRHRVRHDPVKLARLILSLTCEADRVTNVSCSSTTMVA